MQEKIQIDSENAKRRISSLIDELFPIHRTLVNEGYKRSLTILQEQLPFTVLQVPSGKEVFDWVVPQSWNVETARIKDSQGNTLIDFEDHNLHLSAYSQAFNGKISHQDLLHHLNYRKELPGAIPYNYHYYTENWSFNVSYNQFQQLFHDNEYEIEIKTNVYDDYLRIGEVFIQGESSQEVLITSYMCHPSMVNDNLSGVAVTTELFRYLTNTTHLKYSYRLIIVPETIGAISFLSEFPNKCENVVAGLTVYCCGYGDNVHYKRTYRENDYVDQVAEYVFNQLHENATIIPFWPGGSDERQFNSPGIRMPVGAITRTPAAEFREYHTSFDNKELVKTDTLINSINQLISFINVMEIDELYINNYKGEPFFSKHNIAYPTFRDAMSKSGAYIVKILANEVDGTNTLLDISKKWDLNIFQLADMAKEFLDKNLIKKKKS